MLLRVVTLLLCAATGLGADQRVVTVSAAASLTRVLQELAASYTARTGQRVQLNFGGSNTLARQIGAGARVDLFISADLAQMDHVQRFIAPGTRVELLSNQLAVAVPDDRPTSVRSMRDLARADIRRIAIGDPAAVPAGVYARQFLERAGLWQALQPKLVPTTNVRAALAAVEHGAADAAVVYRSDVATASRARAAYVLPADEGPRIVYPAAIIAGGNAAGAARLLAFLQGPEATAAFARAGFTPLAARAPGR